MLEVASASPAKPQLATELFEFDELDRLEEARDAGDTAVGLGHDRALCGAAASGADVGVAEPDALARAGWRREDGLHLPLFSGNVYVHAALSGELLCVAILSAAATVADLKAAIQLGVGVPAIFQGLLRHGTPEELPDELKLSRALDIEKPQVSLLVGYAKAMARVESGELDLERQPELRDKRELVLAAVRRNGRHLRYASPTLRADPEVVVAAVQSEQQEAGISPIAHAEGAAKRCREVALAAVERVGTALEHVAPELRADRSIVEVATRSGAAALLFADDALRDDPGFVGGLMLRDGGAMEFAGDRLKRNRAFALRVVATEGLQLRHFAHEVASDPEVVTTAVRQNWRALQHASQDLRTDPAFVQELLHTPGVAADAFTFAGDRLRGDVAYVNELMSSLYPQLYNFGFA